MLEPKEAVEYCRLQLDLRDISTTECAERLNLPVSYVSNCFAQRRPFSEELATFFGLKRLMNKKRVVGFTWNVQDD